MSDAARASTSDAGTSSQLSASALATKNRQPPTLPEFDVRDLIHQRFRHPGVCIVGPRGSGKTQLMKALITVDLHTPSAVLCVQDKQVWPMASVSGMTMGTTSLACVGSLPANPTGILVLDDSLHGTSTAEQAPLASYMLKDHACPTLILTQTIEDVKQAVMDECGMLVLFGPSVQCDTSWRSVAARLPSSMRVAGSGEAVTKRALRGALLNLPMFAAIAVNRVNGALSLIPAYFAGHILNPYVSC